MNRVCNPMLPENVRLILHTYRVKTGTMVDPSDYLSTVGLTTEDRPRPAGKYVS